MNRKLTWIGFFLLTIISITFTVIYKDHHLYFSVFFGLSYIFWSFAFIFSTPFYWIYKVEEAIYVVWLIGLSCYFYYAELYIVFFLFFFPVFLHYFSWAKKQEQKAMFYMLIRVEETKDPKLFETFIKEIQKRSSSLNNPHFIRALPKLEKLMKEEQSKKTKE